MAYIQLNQARLASKIASHVPCLEASNMTFYMLVATPRKQGNVDVSMSALV